MKKSFARFAAARLMLLVTALAVVLSACSRPMGLDYITVSPTTQSLAVGQTVQFTATGTFGNASNPTTNDVTSQVTWSSSAPAVATIAATGKATAVAAGSATITATIQGYNGQKTATATLTVTGSSGASGNVVSLTLLPSALSVASPGQSADLLAIGTTSSGSTLNITGSVAWHAANSTIATLSQSTSSGTLYERVTGVAQGTTTITALYTNADSTVASGSATFNVVAGTTADFTTLKLYPDSQSSTQAQPTQFFVVGTQSGTGLQSDLTTQCAWSSSNPAVATVGTAIATTNNPINGTPGLVTGLSAGTTTITATYTNPSSKNIVVGTASYTVSVSSASGPLLSINIVPSSVTVSNKGMTAQYLAFGTFSTTPTIKDITNTVTWVSTLPEVASISTGGTSGQGSQGGLATATGYTGNSIIYAIGTNPDGSSILSNSQTFTCKADSGECKQDVATPQFATLTVYIAGQNTANGYITDTNAVTGVKNLIHCGPGWTLAGGAGGSVCTAVYALGSTVVLAESPTGTQFGGWSSGTAMNTNSCTYASGKTLLDSPTCTVTLTGNSTVGVIFY